MNKINFCERFLISKKNTKNLRLKNLKKWIYVDVFNFQKTQRI